MSMKIGMFAPAPQSTGPTGRGLNTHDRNALIKASTRTLTAEDAFDGPKSGDKYKQQYGMSLEEAQEIVNSSTILIDPQKKELAKAIIKVAEMDQQKAKYQESLERQEAQRQELEAKRKQEAEERRQHAYENPPKESDYDKFTDYHNAVTEWINAGGAIEEGGTYKDKDGNVLAHVYKDPTADGEGQKIDITFKGDDYRSIDVDGDGTLDEIHKWEDQQGSPDVYKYDEETGKYVLKQALEEREEARRKEALEQEKANQPWYEKLADMLGF